MAPHSSTLAWKIPWTEKPGKLQSMGSQESDMTDRFHSLSFLQKEQVSNNAEKHICNLNFIQS